MLLDTENGKHKEYKQTERVVVDKQSKEYELIELYQKLDDEAHKRLKSYMEALREMQ